MFYLNIQIGCTHFNKFPFLTLTLLLLLRTITSPYSLPLLLATTPCQYSLSLLLTNLSNFRSVRLTFDSILIHECDLFKTRNASIWNREDAHMWARKAAKKLLLLYDSNPDLLHRVGQISPLSRVFLSCLVLSCLVLSCLV